MVQGTLKHKDYFALGIIDNIFIFKVLKSLGASPSGKFNSLTTALRLKTKKVLFFCALTFAVSIAKGISEETKDQESFCAVHALNLHHHWK